MPEIPDICITNLPIILRITKEEVHGLCKKAPEEGTVYDIKIA